MNYSPKCGAICAKFLPVMQCKKMHIYVILYSLVSKLLEIMPKTDFLVHSKTFFVYALLHPMCDAPKML